MVGLEQSNFKKQMHINKTVISADSDSILRQNLKNRERIALRQLELNSALFCFLKNREIKKYLWLVFILLNRSDIFMR